MLNDSQSLYALFDELGIAHATTPHQPFFSATDRAGIDAGQWEFPVKNFFVYDKDKTFYLVTVHLDHPPVDFAALSKMIGARGRVSFAREEHLNERLNVRAGSVTPFAVMHDKDAAIKVVLDESLRQSKTISAHPMSNDATTTISLADLDRFYAHTKHAPLYVRVPVKSDLGNAA